MLKSGRWARKWDSCRECHLTSTPHYAKGYCTRCYMRLYKRGQRQNQRAAKAQPGIVTHGVHLPD